MNSNRSIFSSRKSGQSLVEAVVIVYIAVFAITGILTVGMAYLQLGGQSAQRVTAIGLVREGMEVMLAIRNSHRLNEEESWPDYLTNGDYVIYYDSTDYYGSTSLLSADNADITQCANCGLCSNATMDVYESCVQEEFRRLVSVSDGGFCSGGGSNDGTTCAINGDCDSDNCDTSYSKKITSQVYWKDRLGEHTITLENLLTDWREDH